MKTETLKRHRTGIAAIKLAKDIMDVDGAIFYNIHIIFYPHEQSENKEPLVFEKDYTVESLAFEAYSRLVLDLMDFQPVS